MTAAHERLYRRTLHQLVAAGVPFGVLGTFALRQQCPTLPRHLVADCDLLLPPDPMALSHLTTLLQADGWHVTLWEQPLVLPLRAADLTGKYYLRARRAGAVLDCAYENDFLSWPDFRAECQWHHGLPLLTPAAILRQKAQVGRPTDLVVLRWWQREALACATIRSQPPTAP
ncbi:hypothetical protein [Hymenobacter swuensis]|uniref:Nucleotidyltransferase family protein n=1 Tax=Hymenobacter swuensis DY53 TaxID=1227739 RepID=W8EYU4_9BACT|nr:hypothetical protein [Hymenobacter swuensis]AHJ95501.1 hypothetical protein Hsw_PA0168 [Hymenobacter swuensis DY53]